jgi:hypothetical protein
MKAKITKVNFKKEYETKFGILYGFEIGYIDNGNEKTGLYSSKRKDQNKFIVGNESEFDVEFVKKDKGGYHKIKPVQVNMGYSNAGRSMQREQSKYSGFAMAYAKDLVVSGHINTEQMFPTAKKMIDWMVEQDKMLIK